LFQNPLFQNPLFQCRDGMAAIPMVARTGLFAQRQALPATGVPREPSGPPSTPLVGLVPGTGSSVPITPLMPRSIRPRHGWPARHALRCTIAVPPPCLPLACVSTPTTFWGTRRTRRHGCLWRW